MAALTTFAELMARASATVFSQLYSNALEKAQQQHQLNIQSQQQTIAPFPIIPALMASVSIPTGMPCISPISQQQQVIITTNENKVKEEKRLVEQENGNCSNKINRKRKRSKNNNNNETKTTIQQTIKVEEKTTQQQQQQIKQEQCCSNNSSPSLANTSRISSPDSTTVHKGRKLKLYAAEEKTDIIDYAKCIGNRAAGREFNVAESSIREWRKNEDKIRKQAETTAGCTQHFEKNQKEILTRIDDELVKMLNSKDKRCTTWYGIAEQVNSLWESIAKELSIENSQMKITMGWVSRFMRRNEQRVPKVTPPIIATSYSNITNTGISISSSSNSSLSNTSTRKSNNACNATASKQQPIETKTKSKSKAAAAAKIKLENNENNITENNELKCSRRKRFRPVRVNAECATLITSFAIKEEIQQNCES